MNTLSRTGDLNLIRISEMKKYPDCPFCHPDREIILKGVYCYAIYDMFPVNRGHILVITDRHVGDYFAMEQDEIEDLWETVRKARDLLEEKYSPQGFNVGFNVGEPAGQTIDHVHIHVIPRYSGDMEDPTGGVRHVIPERGKY